MAEEPTMEQAEKALDDAAKKVIELAAAKEKELGIVHARYKPMLKAARSAETKANAAKLAIQRRQNKDAARARAQGPAAPTAPATPPTTPAPAPK